MATGSRVLWKGAISFGLVHIPVGLHTASSEGGIDFDWLDRRTMDPVGYQRINKTTGKRIDKDDVVKGVEYEDGKYVIVSADEIAAAYPRTTQTIEIMKFVDAADIPFVYLERPYYLAPINKGHKVYALLREALLKTGKIGLATVVIQTKQHLAALVPSGPALVLNLLRWGDEIKSFEGLDLPPAGVRAASLNASEMKMAEQLIGELSGPWDPAEFKDGFKQSVLHLVEEKVKAGKTEAVTQPHEDAPSQGADILDLTELLARSLKGKAAAHKPTPAKAKARAPAKTAAKASTKTPAKASGKRAAAPASSRRKAA